MLDHIVLDVESKTPIKELPNGWNSTHLMGVGCAVIYSFKEDKYSIYGDTKGELLDLQNRLLKADRVTTWNGWRCDFPMIWGLQTPHTVLQMINTSDDMLRRAWIKLQLNPDIYDPNTHGGLSLDDVSKNTIGSEGKTGSGESAPLWLRAGQWGRTVDYCLNDVKLTRDLCLHVDKTGFLIGKNGLYVNIGKDWKK
jgi:DEAD/DEAH box helicase domain-containing protein